MRKLLSLLTQLLVAVLLLICGSVKAQQGQTLHIVKGKQVILRADATHALSYIWFYNDEPLQGQHNQRLVAQEEGIYTVMALGHDCNSDMSDPVEIVVDPEGEIVYVDLEVRNLPEITEVRLRQEFNYQLMVLNNSAIDADDVVVTFALPINLTYLGIDFDGIADIQYNESTRELTWRIPKLEAGEAASQWIRVRGEQTGQVITLARVSSRQPDVDPSNNTAESIVNIVNFFIPNVFTPNGDGVNDTFEIVGLELFRSNVLRIYNRHGNEVYAAMDYQSDWDGQGLNDGTYYYHLEIVDGTGKKHHHKGYVTIIRTSPQE